MSRRDRPHQKRQLAPPQCVRKSTHTCLRESGGGGRGRTGVGDLLLQSCDDMHEVFLLLPRPLLLLLDGFSDRFLNTDVVTVTAVAIAAGAEAAALFIALVC